MPRGPRPSAPEAATLALFFLSGASALIYEVVWSRQFTFVFGGTAAAIATVLAAYMAGLALGSWVAGRRIDQGGHPLRVYAWLEAGIAGWALGLPLLLAGLDGLHAALYRQFHPGAATLALIRFLLAFLVLLVPTTLMGATLPVLARLVAAGGGDAARIGRLYGTNTAGAVAGTAAAGFLLVPGFGLWTSTVVAVVFNLAVAALALLLARRLPVPAVAAGAAGQAGAPGDRRGGAGGVDPDIRRTALIVYGLSGLAALACEVAWTKALSGVLGTTTYAFSAMLTTFLLGLALGALAAARLVRRFDAARLLAWTQLGIAVIVLATVPFFGELPLHFVEAYRRWGASWGAQVGYRFLLCAVAMLPATLLMGAAFPLVARLHAERPGDTGRRIGDLYAVNTVGAIVGSLAAGFVLVPALGRQGTMLAAALVNVAGAALLYGVLARKGRLPRPAMMAAAATAIVGAVAATGAFRPWDRWLQTSGAYVYAPQYAALTVPLGEALRAQNLLYFREEAEATIAVTRLEHVLSLRLNGKVDASSSGDMGTQIVLAQAPLLHHARPESVLVIGLASGVSAGSALTHASIRHLDCLEILPAMPEATRFFDRENGGVLDDPRFHLVVGDGRHHLRLTERRYDVILSEPSNPWIAGIGALFTREYFRLVADRLAPGGIYAHWVQTYHMERSELAAMLRTFAATFPHREIWIGSTTDLILLGSMTPITAPADLPARLAAPRVAADLARIGVRDARSFRLARIGGATAIERLAGGPGPMITDDNLMLEFRLPRHVLEGPADPVRLAGLAAVREPSGGAADPCDRARGDALAGIDRFNDGDAAGARRLLEAAVAACPDDPLARDYCGRVLLDAAQAELGAGRAAAAGALFERVLAIGAGIERAQVLNYLGQLQLAAGQLDSAEVLLTAARDIEPRLPPVQRNLGLLYESRGDLARARTAYREALAGRPGDPDLAARLEAVGGAADAESR
jgi:spermidine synthase